MKVLSKVLLPSTALLLLFSSCSKSSGTDNPNTGGTNGSTNAGPLFTAVRSVVHGSCAVAGCHAGASPEQGIDFNNDNTIVAKKDRIKVRAVDQAGTANQMPKGGPALSQDDQKKITDWITAGGRITD